MLDKQTIIKHYDEFLPSNIRRRFLFKGTTSGTTGTRLSLCMNRDVIEREHAFVDRQYSWAGLARGGRIATFTGDLIVPVEQKKPPFWRIDRYSNELFLSNYHMSDHSLEYYLKRIKTFAPTLICAYPSTLFLIAKYIIKHKFDIRMNSLRGLIANSETLYPFQRKIIEKAFGIQIYNLYGHFERVVKIATCEFGTYHVFPDYGITEFIPVAGSKSENTYELVGTGFINEVMPLVRYRTNDLVTLSDKECQCGRNFVCVDSIMGRSNDVILNPEGRVIPMIDSVFNDIEHVKMAQVRQKSLNNLEILVVVEPGFDKNDEDKIASNLALRVGTEMTFSVKRVNRIPSNPRGKFKLVVSEISN
ncbi:phenylacetate--CoA ligase family protein [Acidobacteriota bacterium]